jgi:hypothetical protein
MTKLTAVADNVETAEEIEATKTNRFDRIKKFATNPNALIVAPVIIGAAIALIIASRKPLDVTAEMIAEDEASTI